MTELREPAEIATSNSFDEGISYIDVAESLAHDYSFVYYVNLETGDFVKYVHPGDSQELVVGMEGRNFFSGFSGEFAQRIHPEDRDTVLTAITKENISRVLSVDRSFILTFRLAYEGKDTYFEVKATRIADNPQCIVAGVTNVDAHMQRIAEYEKAQRDSHTFASILESMASDYLNIFYIDIDTGDYIHYDPRKVYRGVGIDTHGTDFFGSQWKTLISTVHEEDRNAIARSFSREGLKRELRKRRTIIVVCRLIYKDKVKFASVKATRMEGEIHHVVIGVSDVDDQVRREEAHAKALGAAQAIANRDSLTGVKSKHAFTEAESAYNQMIKDGEIDEFAVVVCDVNGLKEVNDLEGHKAGDELICQACKIVCTCFKHSPVYRVGGDEFVAILTGTDYENRANLLQSINSKIEENKRQGGAVIAIGAADFELGADRDFIPVFDRADTAMYARKAELKAL